MTQQPLTNIYTNYIQQKAKKSKQNAHLLNYIKNIYQMIS